MLFFTVEKAYRVSKIEKSKVSRMHMLFSKIEDGIRKSNFEEVIVREGR